MTIELNFVYFKSPFGTVGIIDVPGHRRFVKNMIGGVASIDASLFIVAADDGWMPQSQEHLDILEGLGIRRALAIITKCDLVTEQRVCDVQNDVSERLKRVFSDLEVYLLSTDDSLEKIRNAIHRLLSRLSRPLDRGRARLWVDRVFLVRGKGTVVTGTLREGEIRLGQRLFVLPQKIATEVKGIESYLESKLELGPSHRAAINLTRVAEIRRGDLISGHDDPLTTVFDARIRWFKEGPKTSIRLLLCIGTRHESAHFIPMGESLVRIRLPPVSVRFGDPIVVRSAGGENLLGIGDVIDPKPFPKLAVSRSLIRGVTDGPSFVRMCLKKDSILFERDLFDLTSFSKSDAERETQCLRSVREGWVEPEIWENATKRVLDLIRGSEAVEERVLERRLNLKKELLEAILTDLIKAQQIEKRAYGYVPKGALQTKLEIVVPKKLIEVAPDKVTESKLRRLIADGGIIQLSDHVIDRESYEKMVELVREHLKRCETATTSKLKTVLGLSRNHAVLVLERMDGDRITYLKDAVRRLLR